MDFRIGSKIKRVRNFHSGAPQDFITTLVAPTRYKSGDFEYMSAEGDQRLFYASEWELVEEGTIPTTESVRWTIRGGDQLSEWIRKWDREHPADKAAIDGNEEYSFYYPSDFTKLTSRWECKIEALYPTISFEEFLKWVEQIKKPKESVNNKYQIF